MIETEALLFVDSIEWVNAKSYEATLPHVYTTRRRVGNDALFEAFLELIRGMGVVKSFYRKQYVYLELGEWEYWEMGRPIKAVEVINRALIYKSLLLHKSPVTPESAALLKDKLSQREDYVNALLAIPEDKRTDEQLRHLDFLMCSQRRIHGGGKNIIDHSSKALVYG